MREFCCFVKVIEKKALGKALAGRFAMAMFTPETLMEGGILAVLGVTVEGSLMKSSLLGVVFDMSAEAALPATLFLVEAPAMDLSSSASVSAESLAKSSLFEVLGMSAAASLPTMCFLGEGPVVPFVTVSFISAAVAFFFRVFMPISLLLLIVMMSSEGFILTGVTDVLLAAEENDDGGGAPRRGR